MDKDKENLLLILNNWWETSKNEHIPIFTQEQMEKFGDLIKFTADKQELFNSETLTEFLINLLIEKNGENGLTEKNKEEILMAKELYEYGINKLKEID